MSEKQPERLRVTHKENAVKKGKVNKAHTAQGFLDDFAKRKCEWAGSMFNPCGTMRVMSGGKLGGAPGCWSCRARWIKAQQADRLVKAIFGAKP